MELDDFKNMRKPGIVPEFSKELLKKTEMETFIDELKSSDAKEKKRIIVFITISFMFCVIYSGSLSMEKNHLKDGFALLIAGFLCMTGYFFLWYRRYSRIDYSAPAREFLRDAEKRYRFMSFGDWLIAIPLLILFITGGGIIVYYSFIRYFPESDLPLVIYLLFMTAIIGVGFWASYKTWRKDKGSCLVKIRSLQKELSE